MKIVLVVASGVYAGKEIAIAGAQFVIGRDEGCNLRPASPAISKRHCAVFYKDGEPYVRDLGSTNGTFLNDAQVEGDQPLREGDKVRVGPLDFTVKGVGGRSDSTPLPNALKSVAGTGAASSASSLRPVGGTPGAGVKPAPKPAPAPTPGAGANPVPAATSKPPAPAPKPAAKPAPAAAAAPTAAAPTAQEGDDHIAAMLLGMSDEDGDPPHVPEGSTVMEMPAVDAMGNPLPPPKPVDDKKKVMSQEDSSSIARDLLSKMTRRPR